MNLKNTIKSLAAIALIIVFGSCDRDRNTTGWQYFDDMAHSAGKELINPYQPTAENIARGKEVFAVYCMNCHGDKGDGKGFLFTSGKYPFPPKTLLSEIVKNGHVG